MDEGRWRLIEDLFHQASDLPTDQRDLFLAKATGADEELRAEVESLLESSSTEDDPVVDLVGKTLKDVAFEGTQQQNFGPYQASRWLGGGSHSDVYLAFRTDGEYQAEVAIKVAKRGFPTEDLRQRFRQERQILASLEHPNIARILDGGTTEDGLPFFVMEYVDGEPIDDYCDRHDLPIHKRLELFQAVCSAVEHAHRNLTIHRDLKPSNILVSEDGRPILLDFGIAKLLQPSTSLEKALHTQEGVQLLTPAFASPEQVLGQPLSTATDVYSLGVVLYQLLCGFPPYELEGLEPKALYETICESQPGEPSRALRRLAKATESPSTSPMAIAKSRGESSPGALQQRLKGDLDTIVLMALRKEPERRYASVASLSEDIRFHLQHRPIRARKETIGYRCTKLLRRHPYGVAITGALLLAVVVGILSTMRATALAQTQRDQAQASEAEAEHVTDFMVELFAISSPEISLGKDVSAAEILDRGAKVIGEKLDEQPLSRARLLRAMGRAYHGLGRYDRAEALLGQANLDREEVLGADHVEVALGLIDLSKTALTSGNYLLAQSHTERSLEIYRLAGPGFELEKAAALNLLGDIRGHQGDHTRAEELYRQALELRSSLVGLDHLDSLESLNDLAESLVHQNQLEEAETLFNQVLAGRRHHLSDAHPDTIITLNNIAVVQQAQANLDGAEATMRQVVDGRRQLYGNDHPHVLLAFINLAQILESQGKYGEAEEWTEKALELSFELYPERHPRVADLLHNLGGLLMLQERFLESEDRLTEALEIRRESLGPRHPSFAQSLVRLATLHQQLGKKDLALREAQQSLEILDQVLPKGDFRKSSPMLQIGLLLTDAGRCDEALPYIHRALEMRRKVFPDGHPALRTALEAKSSCESTAQAAEDLTPPKT